MGRRLVMDSPNRADDAAIADGQPRLCGSNPFRIGASLILGRFHDIGCPILQMPLQEVDNSRMR